MIADFVSSQKFTCTAIHQNLLEKFSGSTAWFHNVLTVLNIRPLTGELSFSKRFFNLFNVRTRMKLRLSLFSLSISLVSHVLSIFSNDKLRQSKRWDTLDRLLVPHHLILFPASLVYCQIFLVRSALLHP
jgi:hypothetical protein